MRKRIIETPFVLVLIALTSLAHAAEDGSQHRKPVSLHPDNPHYFLFRGKPTLLISSAEHYGAVLNLDFDYAPYLRELQSKQLNQTRCFSGVYREIAETFAIRGNTLAPPHERYSSPWADAGPGGSPKGGGRKYDLTKWNDAHFQRIRDFVRAAGEHGVIVELVMFCPFYEEVLWEVCPLNAANNVNGVGANVKDRKDVNTLAHKDIVAVHESLTRKVVTELKEFDNVYYEICNEPYHGGSDDWERHIAQVIVDTEKSLNLPHRHLIAQNIANGSKKIEKPDANVSIFNFHYCNPPDAVGQNFALNRPIAYDESGGRDKGDDYYRTHAWQFILAGGSVFSHLDFSFTAKKPDGTDPISAPGGGGPTIRRQLQILQQFMDSFDYLRMKPDGTVLTVEPRDGVTACALVEPGRQYAVYLARTLPEKPGEKQGQPKGDAGGQATKIRFNLPAGKYEVEWINPRTGEIQKSPPLKHAAGEAALDSPKYDHDVALRLKVIQYSD